VSWFSRITHSLSARLVLVFLLGSILYSYSASFAFRLFQDTDSLRQVAGAHIALHAEYVLADIGTPPSIANAASITERIPVDIMLRGPDMMWVSDERFPDIDNIAFGPLSLLNLGEANSGEVEDWIRQVEKVAFARYKERAYVKLTRDGYDIVFLSPPMDSPPAVVYDSALIFSGVGLLVLLLCFAGVRWLISPVQKMQEGAAKIGSGDLNYRIKGVRRDDLGDLAEGINTMADDLQDMLEAKRQLMLAISHELRSPLTRTRVALEFLDDETVKRNLMEDVEEMERLISDILESEALNTRHASLRREPGNLGELVQSVIDLDFAHREEGRIVVNVDGDLDGEFDATRVRLLVRNLIENALRHSPEAAKPVEVTMFRRTTDNRGDKGDEVVFRVTDHGEGMSPQDLERATQPFYRADPARSRHTGGFGLGLYLCLRIVEAHGGEMTIESTQGEGTTVTATLKVSD